MEIDDSDEDEMTAQGSVATPKRKKTGARIVGNPSVLAELTIPVPPPGGETPGKRSKSGNNRLPRSRGPILGATSWSRAVPVGVADFSNNPV